MTDFTDLIAVIRQYSPFLIGCLFFIWRDWQREGRLSTRIETLEREQREIVLPLVRECSAVIAKNSSVIESLERRLLL